MQKREFLPGFTTVSPTAFSCAFCGAFLGAFSCAFLGAFLCAFFGAFLGAFLCTLLGCKNFPYYRLIKPVSKCVSHRTEGQAHVDLCPHPTQIGRKEIVLCRRQSHTLASGSAGLRNDIQVLAIIQIGYITAVEDGIEDLNELLAHDLRIRKQKHLDDIVDAAFLETGFAILAKLVHTVALCDFDFKYLLLNIRFTP